ncbi:steroid receptor-associated and regulated protein [Phyllostomus discolor]|uniref:Steroid receptor-associated and regulated protein n=1 Tax=Phyllostomus discolor TaxID=89673 RepID=A0A6J2LIT1_9CHIR|nr:steroid receptor-associated and regulated protein [Phyllostomus discolor]
MASSDHLRDQRASPGIMGLETDPDTSSGGKPARRLKAVPTAHLTFVIDCARGKPLSLAAPPAPAPQAPGPNPGPVTPPMKTYLLFCGHSRSQLIQEAPLGGEHLAQARGTLPPRRGTVTSAFSSVSPLRSQEPPEAKGSPPKMGPTRSSAWKIVMGALKAFFSCVCGRAD